MNDNRAAAPPAPEASAFLDKVALVVEARELWGGEVAGQLWAKLGLGRAPVAAGPPQPPRPPRPPGEAA